MLAKPWRSPPSLNACSKKTRRDEKPVRNVAAWKRKRNKIGSNKLSVKPRSQRISKWSVAAKRKRHDKLPSPSGCGKSRMLAKKSQRKLGGKQSFAAKWKRRNKLPSGNDCDRRKKRDNEPNRSVFVSKPKRNSNVWSKLADKPKKKLDVKKSFATRPKRRDKPPSVNGYGRRKKKRDDRPKRNVVAWKLSVSAKRRRFATRQRQHVAKRPPRGSRRNSNDNSRRSRPNAKLPRRNACDGKNNSHINSARKRNVSRNSTRIADRQKFGFDKSKRRVWRGWN